VGVLSISPSGPINMGRMFGQWFAYSLFIAVLAAYVTGRTHGLGAPFLEVFRESGAVAFCCYVVALWQNWIWWGQGTRFTVTYSLDGVIFALVTGATFAGSGRTNGRTHNEAQMRESPVSENLLQRERPAALRAWYKEHLGVDVQSWEASTFEWADAAGIR